MALTVENGTGLANAESYVSVADADTRATLLGLSGWTGDTTAKEQALRRATAHMERAYREKWKGARLNRDQALSWPRYGAVVDGWTLDSNYVPADVANACADLAIRALTADLAPDTTRAVIREKVGPLETEYDPYSPQTTQYRAVDSMLAPYLRYTAATACLVRT